MDGKGRALVTGASKGIGAAICRRLRAEGYEVYGLARGRPALEALAEDCGLRPLVADVRDHQAIGAALGDRGVDVLVNNAGLVTSLRPLQAQSAAEIEAMVTVNLLAPLLLLRLLLPGMVARGRGHVVNVTSTAAHHVFAATAAYGAAKAGLSRAGSVLRYDLAGTGVRLTEIAPGRVETDVYLQAFAGDGEALRRTLYADERPLQPADVAEAVALALALPDHVDVAMMELSPTDQATGGHVIRRPNASV
ncbi:short-chain dehydrogenase [Aureimonas endophytica]|uniref:Short-chain dehydrogenase n=1 Tax=Aureimonas endophytica TaxID=2027858 RepID=A0A917E5D3_9HYPH|nr:SDR family NAD(P)-dependent oxidoreductase [Aureimonas endophytica]GGE05908.1 short-chain dehydrogenase [Aureimonas endophytica]